MTERIHPHSLEAEQAVLGAVLVSGDLWPDVASAVEASDFFREAHQHIYAAMATLAAAGVAVDLLTLREELARIGRLNDVGGPAYIAALTDGVPRAANVAHYAEIVREKARLRSALEAGSWLVSAAYGNGRPAAELVAETIRQLGLTLDANRHGPTAAQDALRAYATSVTEGTFTEPIRTGYADVDGLLGGLRPGELIILAARPAVGKSSWALGAARTAALAGRPVLFFSLEMGVASLAGRLASWKSRVSARRVERGDASEEDWARVVGALTEEDVMPLWIQERARTVAELSAWCGRFRRERGLACVVVDYLQLLAPSHRGGSRQDEVADISRSLKQLATDQSIAVLALSQLSRAPETRRDKRPHLSDLRDSGALEQDADLVLLLFRPGMYGQTPENEGIAEVIVAKNRNGPTGVLRLSWNAELAEFRDLETRFERKPNEGDD